MRAGLRFYQVQAQLSGQRGEWSSSRQVRTMIVGASSALDAGTQVSHMAWDASGSGFTDKVTVATAVEVINGDDGGIIATGPMTWVKVSYVGSWIYAHAADSYAEVCKL